MHPPGMFTLSAPNPYTLAGVLVGLSQDHIPLTPAIWLPRQQQEAERLTAVVVLYNATTRLCSQSYAQFARCHNIVVA